MESKKVRQKLHQFIDTIEDKKAEAIYTLFEDEMDTDKMRHKLIMSERERYLQNEGKSFTWENVKEMAQNKDKRDGLSN